MHLIELIDFKLSLPEAEENGLSGTRLCLSRGDACAIQADVPEKASLLIKTLATLVRPETGTYRFDQTALEFADYRKLLPIKKRIGYLAPEAYLISNRTINENLLLMRYYFENSLSLQLDAYTRNLCRLFQIENKLDLRPGQLRSLDLHHVIAIRELAKGSDLFLMDRPENMIGHDRLQDFAGILKKDIIPKQALVFFSYNRYLVENLATHTILIREKNVSAVAAKSSLAQGSDLLWK